MKLQAGAVIPGAIRLVEEIYSRESGVVWRAFDQTRATSVSVKVPSATALAHDKKLGKRFRLENQATTEIHSPHVVRVISAGTLESGEPFVVMERLDGEPLSARLEREGKLPLEDVDRLVEQAGAGLSAAHAVGIIHRDINPETLFLHLGDGARPTVKIVDFGIAKVISGKLTDPRLTAHGRLLGTPAYLSPERASAKKPTPHADMWSLAVVAYQALVGKLPFVAKSLGLMLVKIIEGDYDAPTQLRPDLGGEVDRWFERCFAQQPTMRFKNVHDMAGAFSIALADSDDALDWSL